MLQREPTPDDIRIAYLLFLGREPESEAAVEAWRSAGSYEALSRIFLHSSEFRSKHPDLTTPRFLPADAPPLDVEWQVDGRASADLLSHIKTVWTRLGQERPHWSVLSADRFSPENIVDTAPEFFASGAEDVAMLLGSLRRHGLSVEQFPRVLEYGCGLARVTPHLARTFQSVTACDVSTSHLEAAQRVVAASGVKNVALNLVDSSEFGMSGPFDLWFSRIVLQHNPPPIIASILRRCFALLAPGGIAAFQVPTYAVNYRFRTAEYIAAVRSAASIGGIEMHVLPQAVIFQIAAEAGCWPLEVWQDAAIGQDPAAWTSNSFLFRKEAAPRQERQNRAVRGR